MYTDKLIASEVALKHTINNVMKPGYERFTRNQFAREMGWMAYFCIDVIVFWSLSSAFVIRVAYRIVLVGVRRLLGTREYT